MLMSHDEYKNMYDLESTYTIIRLQQTRVQRMLDKTVRLEQSPTNSTEIRGLLNI